MNYTRHTERSLRAVLNNSGNNVQAMAFDPWGQRRNAADWPSLLTLYQPGRDSSHTTRGLTSHEHLDALGLIHMNGRVYDPYLGRFTSADPFIQFPHHSQRALRIPWWEAGALIRR